MRTRLASVIVLTAVLLVACGRPTPPSVRFEAKGAPLTAIEAEKLAASTDIASLAGVTTEDASTLRAAMLEQLRAFGADGERAADLLTAGFPKDTASVPVLVRVCRFEGRSAFVVVEAFGDAGGALAHRRLWVFDATTGNVVRAASFR